MTRHIWLPVIGAFIAGVPTASAADLDRLAVGTRGAFSASSYNDPFVQVEAFADWSLPDHRPWRFESASGCYLQSRLDLAAGWLTGQSEDAFISSLGPSISLGKLKFPVSIDVGCSPTVLTRHQFRETDLGCAFQFTSHLGVRIELGSRVSVGYRFQHMSNAGLSDNNPGLDLHSVGVSYRF